MDVASFINSFLPGTGDVQSAAEGYQAFKDKDYLGAALGAAGALPGIPGITKYVKGKNAADILKNLKSVDEQSAPIIIVPQRGVIKDLMEKTRKERGDYMARRVERAADEVPNLEQQYTKNALEKTFDESNPQALTVLNPKNFEEYAEPLSPGLIGNLKEYKGFQVPEGMTYDQYIDYLAKIARDSGLSDVPFLVLEGTKSGGVRIGGHEGRHRTRALSKLGDESTLVRVLPDYDLTPSEARRYKEDYIEALKARLGLNPTVQPEIFPDVELPMLDVFKHGGEVTKFIKSKK